MRQKSSDFCFIGSLVLVKEKIKGGSKLEWLGNYDLADTEIEADDADN